MRRSRARMRPHVSSATAIAFLPGQFETAIARAEGSPFELRLVKDLAADSGEAVQAGLFERVCDEHFHGEPQNRCTKRPERSFGSNHVDFGGIVAPASAIAMTSARDVGNIENATAPHPERTRPSSSPVPRIPPTKSKRGSVRGTPMPRP